MQYNKKFYFRYAQIAWFKNIVVSFLFLFFHLYSEAKNYYFSSSAGNDSYTRTQAQSQATPWKSIARLNALFNSIVPGDNIYLKRGDIFFGAITISQSGTSDSLITIGAYGIGNKPVITGLITLSSWSLISSGIYQAAAPAINSNVNLVTLNGVPQAVGRYPNADAPNGGYLTYGSYSGSSSITDNQLTGATNWLGAEAIIRKQHYTLEKCKITNQSGSVISYVKTASINPLNNTMPFPVAGTNGFGYFIQRDPRTLDELGEWFFDSSSKNLQVYFGSNNPASFTVMASTVDTLINIGIKNFININNIAFEGANVAAIYAANAGNLTVQSCDMNLMGGKGVLFFDCPNVLIDSLNVSNALCGSIDVTSRHQNNVTVKNCTIKNNGMIPGMGSFWDDNDYKSISVSVSSGALIENNSIDSSGFVGIQFQGSNVTVQHNFINYYDIVKDDGGGIYTYQAGTDAAPGTIYTNRVVKENIVMNGIGASAGTNTGIDVDGIFLDGRVTNVDILNNTVANIGVNGIYTNNSINVNIRGNTSFNNGSAIGVTRYPFGYFSGLNIKQNIFYPKYPTQDNFKYADLGINSPSPVTIQAAIQRVGLVDSNYYSTPNSTGFFYYYSFVNEGANTFPRPLGFEDWKSFTNHDKSSIIAPKVKLYNLHGLLGPNLVSNGQFTSDINAITTWSVDTVYTSWDNTSKISGTGSLKITPSAPDSKYTLIYGSVGAVSSSKKYILRFTTLGSGVNGVLNAYIRKSASPQTVLTPVQTANFGTSALVHEFLFAAPSDESAASFMIEIQQASGTVYIDDIQFYEADATLLDIDDQLKFEYNPTNNTKVITLNAVYRGIDSAVYIDNLVLPPYTSKILLKADLSGQALLAAATAQDINCFGGATTATVAGYAGVAPYSGTGTFTVNAGTGSLKISVPNPVADAYTLLYSTIGAVSSSKNYVLRFTTLGTTNNGALKVYLRQTDAPYGTLTPIQYTSFGTSRIDHQFIFTAPSSQAAASFTIEVLQSSGTTYIDNIAFFEATSTGALLSNNLYPNGQFESSISNITAWSATNNHIASLDLTSKITNTYYYTVKDATGAMATAALTTTQPAAALQAIVTAANLFNIGGTTTATITASGGTAPYTGTGTFANLRPGYKYTYMVSDANGCSSVVTFTPLKQNIIALTPFTYLQNSTAKMGNDNASFITGSTLIDNTPNEQNTLKINIYPNPAIDQFVVVAQGGSTALVNIIVQSIDGKMLYKAKGVTNQKYAFGNDFLPGVYIMKVTQGNKNYIFKILKGKL